jgi:hypothetical protein
MSLTLNDGTEAMIIPGPTGESHIVTNAQIDMSLTEFIVFATWALGGGMFGHSSPQPLRSLPPEDYKALLDKLATKVERLRDPFTGVVKTS